MHDARNYCRPVLYIQSTQPYLYITVQIHIQKIHLYVYFQTLPLSARSGSISRLVSEPSYDFHRPRTAGCTHAGPCSGVVRCQPSARRPTGRRRRPEASAPSAARPRGVFSEMPPRNRALGDGGAGQVHGQASVRLALAPALAPSPRAWYGRVLLL